MKVRSVINNDVVLALDDNFNEVLLIGNDIGKTSKVNNQVDTNKIERILKMNNPEELTHLVELLSGTDSESLRETVYIIDQCERLLGNKVDTRLFITLTDHILFSLKRLKEGIVFHNQLLKEIRKFYPEEFSIAREALKALKKEYNTELPEDEAGYIALHLVNSDKKAKFPVAETTDRIINNSMKMIELTGVDIKEDSLSYKRFIKHFRNIIDRAFSGKMSKEEDPVFFETIKKSFPKAYKTAKRIRDYIYNRYSILLTEEELINLTLYLNRLIANRH